MAKAKIEIGMDELTELTVGSAKKFPKYVGPILNLANQFSQATRPDVVGQLSDMIQRCPYKTYEGWKSWYLNQKPNAINEATRKMMNMMKNFKIVINTIDERVVKEWVEDLVLVKTFIGLRFQEAILKKIASIEGVSYRLATPEEESRGIDGYVGESSVSIKPQTYRAKPSLKEELKADRVIFYEKKKNGIVVYLD
ncbi:MAG: MjaI family restriction endonuclease [Candidatus Caldarchaeum sp.]